MEAALYGARMMNVFERSSPLVAMSAISDLVNGWPGGIIQAGRDGAFVTPLYHVNRMWAAHAGRERLRATVEGPTLGAVFPADTLSAPALDATASRSARGDTIFVKLVNADPARAVLARVEVSGAAVRPAGEWELLGAARPGDRNDFATPEAIVPRRAPLRVGSAFTVHLPPRSVAVVSLAVGP
jgi:alpha-L-arabinofuranosidase